VIANGLEVPKHDLVDAINHFEEFYEEIFMQFANYGEIEDLVVADNIGDHMIGNVWIKYVNEDSALNCMNAMQGLFYAGRTIVAEFVPVTDFREAKCRKHQDAHCDRGGYCNFLHAKFVSEEQRYSMF
jgi:splicing factor U2AF subunit